MSFKPDKPRHLPLKFCGAGTTRPPCRPCNDVFGENENQHHHFCTSIFFEVLRCTEKCAAPDLILKKFNLFFHESPLFLLFFLSFREELSRYISRHWRVRRPSFCVTAMQASRTRVPVAASLPPPPTPTIYFSFSSVLCYGHVCQTPYAAFAAAVAVFGGEGEGFWGLTVQVWCKTNGFIAGFFSLFQRLEKSDLFIPVREGERQPSFHALTQVSYEEKPSLYPCDTSLPPKGNLLYIIVMQTSHERKPSLHSF